MLKMRQLQRTIADNKHHNLSVWKRNQILRTFMKVSLLTQSEGTGSLMLKTLQRMRIPPSKAQFSSAVLIREERDASTTEGTVTRYVWCASLTGLCPCPRTQGDKPSSEGGAVSPPPSKNNPANSITVSRIQAYLRVFPILFIAITSANIPQK